MTADRNLEQAAEAGDEPAIERLEATVHGRVQGVGFRYWVVKRATSVGATGWVANEPDGTVRCVAEGAAAALDELERLLGHGPIGSQVERVQVVRMPATGTFSGFAVRSSGHQGD